MSTANGRLMEERMCNSNSNRFTVGVIGQDRIEFGRRLGRIYNRSEKKSL
jgi:hypothetical protein